MKHFIIKAGKPADKFYFEEASEHIYLLASGLDDLKKTIRCITPKGIRVKSARWWSKRLKHGSLELEHPLFRTLMFHIKPLQKKTDATKEIDYTPQYNVNARHLLKIGSVENWPS